MKTYDLNVYFDADSQSWICEILTIDGWITYGHYGSKADALQML